jgi:hypothetical protein
MEKSIDAVSASASEKDGVISITLCNLDLNKSQKISFDLSGFNPQKQFQESDYSR